MTCPETETCPEVVLHLLFSLSLHCAKRMLRLFSLSSHDDDAKRMSKATMMMEKKTHKKRLFCWSSATWRRRAARPADAVGGFAAAAVAAGDGLAPPHPLAPRPGAILIRATLATFSDARAWRPGEGAAPRTLPASPAHLPRSAENYSFGFRQLSTSRTSAKRDNLVFRPRWCCVEFSSEFLAMPVL